MCHPRSLPRCCRALVPPEACPVLGEGFFFGLATAPAHVEDSLDDSWLDFAEVGRVRYEDVTSAKPGDEPFDVRDGALPRRPCARTEQLCHCVPVSLGCCTITASLYPPLHPLLCPCAFNVMLRHCPSPWAARSMPPACRDALHPDLLPLPVSQGQGLPVPPVKAWKNEAVPQDRLRFWSDPEAEIQLAAGAGVEALRLGVDWGRLVPREPLNGTALAVSHPLHRSQRLNCLCSSMPPAAGSD